jgi:uncharacterized protein (TIRG00374 family)
MKILKFLLPVIIATGLLYWVFKDIDFVSTLQSFKEANYLLVAVGLVVALLSHILRAFRWNLMLEPMGYKASLKNTTVAVLIGYLTNLVLPRAGELARAASLQKSENIPFEKSFGAVIAERVIDVFFLGFLILLNLFLEFDRIKDLLGEMLGEKFANGNRILLILIFLIVLGVLALALFMKFKESLLKVNLISKIWQVVLGLWAGFSSVLKLKNPWVFIAHSLLIWSMYYLSTYILCKAAPIGAELSGLAVLTILVMGAIGMAAPTLGGIGSYHFLVGKIVVLYGLSAQEGINLATFLHSIQGILYVVVLGLGAFLFNLYWLNRKEA